MNPRAVLEFRKNSLVVVIQRRIQDLGLGWTSPIPQNSFINKKNYKNSIIFKIYYLNFKHYKSRYKYNNFWSLKYV